MRLTYFTIFILNIIMFTSNVNAHKKEGNTLNSKMLKHRNSHHAKPELQKFFDSQKQLSPLGSKKVSRNSNYSKNLIQKPKNKNGTKLAEKAVAKEFAITFKQILFNAANAEKDDDEYEGGLGEAMYNNQYHAELINGSEKGSKLGPIATMVYKQMKSKRKMSK